MIIALKLLEDKFQEDESWMYPVPNNKMTKTLLMHIVINLYSKIFYDINEEQMIP